MSDNLTRIKRLLVGLAEFYNEDLTEQKLKLYAAVLADLPADQVQWAIGECFKDPAIVRMPFPAKLREMVQPTLSLDDATQELLSRCQRAVELYGFYQPQNARRFLGELVWKSLGGATGWARYCLAGDTQMGGVPLGTARAQLRDAIRSSLSVEHPSGRVPELPEPSMDKVAELPKWDPMKALEQERLERMSELHEEQVQERKRQLMEQVGKVIPLTRE